MTKITWAKYDKNTPKILDATKHTQGITEGRMDGQTDGKNPTYLPQILLQEVWLDKTDYDLVSGCRSFAQWQWQKCNPHFMGDLYCKFHADLQK